MRSSDVSMIAIDGCRKSYPSSDGGAPVCVVGGIDLTIRPAEFVCMLGPSGCGKTTLLRMIAGLVRPDEGHISIEGAVVTGPGPNRGMVFQDFALLPWADVLTNVAFGLELRGVPKDVRLARARTLVASMGLSGFEQHYPHQLSGGMQQRVGLARALAIEPAILLMDEPFGALDAQTRRELQEDLLELHSRTQRTVVFVTHSVDEAVRLGDRIVVLSPRPARIEEIVEVDLPRPRPPMLDLSPRFAALKEHLWTRIRKPRGAAAGSAHAG
ncbi:MAG: ABC transporter ATP-binding protein [Vicinamibacterales bacterium]